jgi:molybdopterin-guanine dinucleotide biosynthesis protein A
MTPARTDIVAGIFVGGRARRMGGRPKGLLRAPSGETLVARWRRLLSDVGVPCVLVGAGAGGDGSPRAPSAYASEGLDALDDDPPNVGPLGGLVALLEHAGDRWALAVACDMPFVSEALLAQLVASGAGASGVPGPRAVVDAVAPHVDGRWEPFFALYRAERVLPVARTHASSPARSLGALLDAVHARPFALGRDELRELRDWDTPEDIERG